MENKFLELAKSRYSVRKFKSDEIPQECIDKILEAARLAPTACNNQPQRITVVKSKEGLAKAFNLPENLESTALLVMGYPADGAIPAPGHNASKALSDFVKYE